MPHLLETINSLKQKLAYLAHILLYLLMVLVPLSGYLMSNSFGYPVNFIWI